MDHIHVGFSQWSPASIFDRIHLYFFFQFFSFRFFSCFFWSSFLSSPFSVARALACLAFARACVCMVTSASGVRQSAVVSNDGGNRATVVHNSQESGRTFWATRSSICSFAHSLICLLRTARFARALRCVYLFARLLTHSLPSL